MHARTQGQSESGQAECVFPAAPQGGAHQARLEMRGSPWCALGIMVLKRTRLRDRSTAQRMRMNTGVERGDTHTCTWIHTQTNVHEQHAHAGNRIHDMTIGSCCCFHHHRGGEAASTKEVSMMRKCCREACAWLQVSTSFTVVVVVGPSVFK